MAAISAASVKRWPRGIAAADCIEGGLGIGEGGDPAVVLGRHDFGGEDGVDANAVRGELCGPFTGEGELRAFGGGIGGGVALAGERDFGADVHDGAAGCFEHGQRVVGEGVVVDEVFVKAFDEALGGAGFEANAVVGAGVVDEAEDGAVLIEDLVDGGAAVGEVVEVGFDEVAGVWAACISARKAWTWSEARLRTTTVRLRRGRRG